MRTLEAPTAPLIRKVSRSNHNMQSLTFPSSIHTLMKRFVVPCYLRCLRFNAWGGAPNVYRYTRYIFFCSSPLFFTVSTSLAVIFRKYSQTSFSSRLIIGKLRSIIQIRPTYKEACLPWGGSGERLDLEQIPSQSFASYWYFPVF